MNKIKQAITHLTMLRRLDAEGKKDIYDTAISALEAQQTVPQLTLDDAWILVSKMLPPVTNYSMKRVNATIKMPSGFRRVYPLIYENREGKPVWCHMNRVECKHEVIAWMPLPTPYKEVE